MKKLNAEQVLQRAANSAARKLGCGKADEFTFGNDTKILKRLSYGYRKKTTGQYVPNAYLKNFGWKNTYYQQAYTKIMLSKNEYCKEYQLWLVKEII